MPGRRVWRWRALVVVLGAAAIALTVLPRGAGDRGATALLVIPGLVVGAAAGLALATRPAVAGWRRATRARTGPERFNDVAFSVVLVALWAVLASLLGRWSGLLTGIIVGLAVGATARPTDAADGPRADPG